MSFYQEDDYKKLIETDEYEQDLFSLIIDEINKEKAQNKSSDGNNEYPIRPIPDEYYIDYANQLPKENECINYYFHDLEKERDMGLIEEYQKEEIIEDIPVGYMSDYDLAMAYEFRFDHLKDEYDFYPSPAYEYLEELHCRHYDVQFQEQINDVNDYIDYPNGPNENLTGVYYGEPHMEYFDEF